MMNLNNKIAEEVFTALREMSRSVTALGSQAKINEIAQEIISGAQPVLRCRALAMFIIDSKDGSVYSLKSTYTTDEMASAFETIFAQEISNTLRESAFYFHPDEEPNVVHAQLRNEGIHTVLASPVRSLVGINGILAAFYSQDVEEPNIMLRAAEFIADIATVVMTYAYTIEQSHLLLDDLAGSTVELFTQASEDPLTGLHNHRYMQQTLATLCRTRKKSGSFSFIMADVDYFKRFNDTFGHLEGDHVLQEISAILRSHVRQSDVVSRYGGEEFGIILSGADGAKALEIAERIRLAVENAPWEKAPITLSLGIASFPNDATVPCDLIRRADEALYQAKKDGRNRTCVWSKQTISCE